MTLNDVIILFSMSLTNFRFLFTGELFTGDSTSRYYVLTNILVLLFGNVDRYLLNFVDVDCSR